MVHKGYNLETTPALDTEMTQEAINAMKKLAAEGMTMIIATYETGFVADVSMKVTIMDQVVIIEEGPLESNFKNPHENRAKAFLKCQGSIN